MTRRQRVSFSCRRASTGDGVMDKYDVAFPGLRAKRKNLEADLAEARAQIAAKDAVASELGPYWSKWLDHWKGRAEKAEAQIAAKDAELKELKGQWERLLEAYSAAKARSEQ
jgi:hypothetical protein